MNDTQTVHPLAAHGEPDEADRAWLASLPEQLRNVTAQRMHRAVRAGATTPGVALFGFATLLQPIRITPRPGRLGYEQARTPETNPRAHAE
jgi:hypothetical protein